MTSEEIAAAVRRVESALRRRPEVGLHDDAPASARWDGGLKVVATNPNGFRLETDMPSEMGGCGQDVTPGWLLRAGLASCAATRIALAAASEGIALRALDVTASSRSDVRGILAMKDASGAPVSAGPREVRLHVRICAPGVPQERLKRLVEDSHRSAPVSCAMQEAIPVALHVEVEDR
jgi:organic hydroperoxide reductase OsmC/OhrA